MVPLAFVGLIFSSVRSLQLLATTASATTGILIVFSWSENRLEFNFDTETEGSSRRQRTVLETLTVSVVVRRLGVYVLHVV